MIKKTKTKTKTTKKTTKKAAHVATASTATDKRILSIIKRAGKQYVPVADVAAEVGTSTSWVAVTVRRLREAGEKIQSKRGIGGGYRYA